MPFHTKRIAKLRAGRPGRYRHFFGGPPRHRGATPKGRKHPVHLIFDLDLRDPKLGLQFPGITRLPLYNALQYNCCDMVYRVIDDEAIEILSLGDGEWLPDHPYMDYPPEFTQLPVVAEQISYDDYKTLVFGFTTSNDTYVNMWSDLSLEDRRRARELAYPFTQVGGAQFMWQGVPIWSCPNRGCEYFDEAFLTEVFAVVWECPVPEVNLWEPGPPDKGCGSIQLIFSRCRGCGSIHSCNRCD